jgi:hypothetical protein
MQCVWKSLPYAGAWLAATATSVTVGVAAVRFVVHTTAPSLALVTAPESYSPVPAPPVATPTRRPTPTASAGPSSPAPPRHTPSHGGRPSSPPPSSPGLVDTVAICADESGDIESTQAKGGLVAVRFTPSGACLISALPRLGFGVQTTQPTAVTVVVTFTSAHRKSVVTATSTPAPHFDTQES